MKKVIVVLLALAFVGAMVSAQDAEAAPAPAPKLSLSGVVQTGIELDGTSAGGNPTLKLKDNKGDGDILEATFNVGFGDGATWGLNSGLNFSNAADKTTLGVADTNVWYKPITQLKMTFGKAGFGDFGVLTNGNGAAEPDTTSFRLDVLPIDGLLISAYLPVATVAGDFANNFGDMAFGAKYSMDKVFHVAMEYFLKSSAAVANFNGSAATGSGEYVASVGLDAVENLTVEASVDLILGDTATQDIFENVAYNFGVVKPQIYARQTLAAAGNLIEINPQLSFTLVKDVFNPWIGFDYKIQPVGDNTWSLGVNNTFTVGNNGIKVQFDLNGGSTTTWDVKVSYDLSWSN